MPQVLGVVDGVDSQVVVAAVLVQGFHNHWSAVIQITDFPRSVDESTVLVEGGDKPSGVGLEEMVCPHFCLPHPAFLGEHPVELLLGLLRDLGVQVLSHELHEVAQPP